MSRNTLERHRHVGVCCTRRDLSSQTKSPTTRPNQQQWQLPAIHTFPHTFPHTMHPNSHHLQKKGKYATRLSIRISYQP